VAGKGISAALLMATIQSTMRTQLGANNGAAPRLLSTAKLVANLNRQLYANTAPEKYATFYFAMYRRGQHALTYTNAGHFAHAGARRRRCRCSNPPAPWWARSPSRVYQERTVPLEHGDMLVAYTDGIVEPENAYGEMFGEERLKELLPSTRAPIPPR
jgi:phosphoserine phosphatase RsbU/P